MLFEIIYIEFALSTFNLEMAINFPAGWMENYNKVFKTTTKLTTKPVTERELEISRLTTITSKTLLSKNNTKASDLTSFLLENSQELMQLAIIMIIFFSVMVFVKLSKYFFTTKPNQASSYFDLYLFAIILFYIFLKIYSFLS